MAKRKPGLGSEQIDQLRRAYKYLEHPSLAARLSNFVGTPLEQGIDLLPKSWQATVQRATESSIRRALNVAISSRLARGKRGMPTNRTHKLLAMTTGAVGGFIGPLSLLAELPITTILMLRSIADIAEQHGEDLSAQEARLACMQVFALGGRTGRDRATETGYYGLRITLGLHFSRTLVNLGPGGSVPVPGAIELVRSIAARFGVVISDGAALKMIPVAGAVTGAALNVMFMQHFQDIACGHFIVRRLEREFDNDSVRAAYETIHSEQQIVPKPFSPVEGW
jgi:hypothetical protein